MRVVGAPIGKVPYRRRGVEVILEGGSEWRGEGLARTDRQYLTSACRSARLNILKGRTATSLCAHLYFYPVLGAESQCAHPPMMVFVIFFPARHTPPLYRQASHHS
ncbi:hypothetical protein E2C01_084578 [Portunus trituberculatus]|uniref:Uncharacterized protein n=1 Tax=Portunus trituberculatus TaxID=210409 RepID=A0A5B7JB45_PORTR|nr:hypothetical protein [Portunus trituberculatus]